MSPRHTVARVLERLVVIVSAVILMMSVTAVASILVIRHDVQQTARTISPLVDTGNRLRVTLTDAQTNYRAHLLTGEATYRTAFERAHSAYDADVSLFRTQGRGLVDFTHLDQLTAASSTWFRAAESQMDVVDGGGTGSLTQTSTAFTEVVSEHDALLQDIATARLERREQYGQMMVGGVALMGVMTLLALAVTIRQSRGARLRLTRPLEALRGVVSTHQSGAVDVRADTTRGAEEVVAVAAAFNTLVDLNATMRKRREYDLELHRVTGVAAGLLSSSRTGSWDEACHEVARVLDVDGVSIYQLDGEALSPLAAWRSAAAGPSNLQDLQHPALVDLIREYPLIRSSDADTVAALPEQLFERARTTGIRTWLLHRLYFNGEALGVISIVAQQDREWTEPQLEAIARLADYASHGLVERRYIDSLRDLDQQKSDFMATTSHELRTPLTSIAGYLELLVDGDFGSLSDPQTKALDVVARNVERLRALIDDLLLLNRLDSGLADTHRQLVPAGELVCRVIAQFEPVARSAGVDLVVDDRTDRAAVCVDPQQVERMLGNVVSNAVKFTPKGGAVVLTTHTCGQQVRISCRDTGIGIPAADQERLFSRFFRASNARSGHIQGTGLGLAIVRTIARAHGGDVELDSVEGEGTTVTVTLPQDPSGPCAAG